MIQSVIAFSVKNKLIIILFVLAQIGWGIYSLTQISIGAVPDVTNNQVQVITTSRNLSTQDIEQFITYPIELEMANLPGVQEIRSISKFGLSVVTVVFDDEMGTYLPRQLIAEKLKSAAEQIPEGFGTPEMGPITTGLGEIYQYILDVAPGYESEYSIMDLRTIQDWVVKRQLSGIPGVVEVNTWGGYLKQYEVAVNPEKLKAMNVTVGEVFSALEGNNDVTGGGYIEKAQESYFIRGEGLIQSVDDIQKIVVKTVNGIPIYIRDIGSVQFGYATRFGAITGNGEGEKVMGQVMMLKDANSSKVISDVKERVAEVQKNLPKGVVINPFLERTALIDKTTFTVAENLTLGALIVIFVLVLLLGNFRSGLIVASIIPLSLLFSISLMNVFDISANLMSLGAIDFGIIIDGAVIIIEFIVFRIVQQQGTLKTLTGNALKVERDKIIIESTTKMMQPAIFGQIIILIVFIPILALSGIEGKMFRPMALSFSFALLGAMVLSLTYIPVMASLLSRAAKNDKKSWPDRVSEKIMGFIQKIYDPVIHFALRRKLLVLVTALVLLVISVFLFAGMGGEFVPTLDEGDYVVQPVLKTGTSLSQTIEIMTELEKILLNNFSEVQQVVTRIGAAEVPTDPMSMEETDIIIKLKPKDEWVNAETKDELADKMKAAMSVIPGLDFEFTQPIEMRFNELVTGVRADVAIKIYGEDLDVLHENALAVERLVKNVEGAADISVEKVAGLPQITVHYNRDKIAQYGLKLQELNRVVRMAFAGVPAGVVFEGEKRFDLAVRFEKDFRGDIEDMRNLYINLPNGQQAPLREVADIDYGTGPAKISRDDTQRRIVVGINVRNRDVESVVEEIQGILDQNLQLPPGYTITYGGQFENLQNAKRRLMVAVPLALALIFMMLYFTFNSLRQALMVYSAIPLAAIGGVFLLWLRDLPFSISAGVGFIALFGIAVLNGIVLIEYFNELKEKGMHDIHQRVLQGTQMRLRPVLLTASAAALGFFPMALSASAGAEVQRPLATVVIGGLVTATLLTLVVLPILYTLFHKNEAEQPADKMYNKTGKVVIMILLLMGIFTFSSQPVQAQDPVITVEDAIDIALKNNAGLEAAKLKINQHQKLQKTAFDIGKTSLYYSFDENNIAENGRALDVFGISQTIPFPTLLSAQHRAAQTNVQLSEQQYLVGRTQITQKVSQAYYELLYQLNRLEQITYLDSLYSNFAHAANRRYEVGETDYLEKLTAEARYNELSTQKKQGVADVSIAYEKLRQILQAEVPFTIAFEKLHKLPAPQMMDTAYDSHPGIAYYHTLQELSQAQRKVESNKWLPDFQVEYFYGYGEGENARNYRGYLLGINVPLWFGPQNGRVQAQKLAAEVVNKEAENYRKTLTSKYAQLQSLLSKYNEAIRYYETRGLDMAHEIVKVAQRSYESGETGYLQYIQSLESASQIQLTYLENLNQFNQTVLELKYLTNL